MKKVHLKINGVDCRDMGQTEYEYSHQAACGYVRDRVTTNGDAVDCKLCLRSDEMKHYHQLNKSWVD